MNFDWSEFHPLDHHVLDPVCWGWAGGIGRHISLWWNFQFHWPWQPYLAKRACDKGHHYFVPFYNKMPVDLDTPPDGLMCRDCDVVRRFS